jgi:hypothetical protein
LFEKAHLSTSQPYPAPLSLPEVAMALPGDPSTFDQITTASLRMKKLLLRVKAITAISHSSAVVNTRQQRTYLTWASFSTHVVLFLLDN